MLQPHHPQYSFLLTEFSEDTTATDPFFEFNNKIEPNIPITNQVNDDSDCNTYYYII